MDRRPEVTARWLREDRHPNLTRHWTSLIGILNPGRSHPGLESLDTDLSHAATYSQTIALPPHFCHRSQRRPTPNNAEPTNLAAHLIGSL